SLSRRTASISLGVVTRATTAGPAVADGVGMGSAVERLLAVAVAMCGLLLFRAAQKGSNAGAPQRAPRACACAGNPAVIGTSPLDRKLCVPGFRRVYPGQQVEYGSPARSRQALF